ncbi:MAG: cell wall metabolism sensor histidine kinase WalK, partial [Anaerolineae bacterium]|nr:cell wall metabolism sensor histidine kinase WalK [Anaerolineae bacterium]
AVEPDRILMAVGSSLTIKARQKEVEFHLDVPPLFRIAGDGDRLMQAFTNLVDNAIKHTPQGGHVWLRAQPNNGGIQVQVQDTGEGIPPEDLPRIFERFYQVDKSRNRARQGGSGLGLAIAHEIIKAHNGYIQVASQVDVGTVFTVWLPVMK